MIDGIRYHKAIKGCCTYKDAVKAESVVKTEIMKGHYDLVDNTENTTLQQAIDMYLEYSKANKSFAGRFCFG